MDTSPLRILTGIFFRREISTKKPITILAIASLIPHLPRPKLDRKNIFHSMVLMALVVDGIMPL